MILETLSKTIPDLIDEAKDHARIDASTEDALVSSLIASALSAIETRIKISAVPQTLRATLQGTSLVRLPKPPVRSISMVEHWTGTTWETLPTGAYRLEGDYLYLSSTHDRIRVSYEAGAAEMSEAIKIATLILVSLMFDDRTGQMDFPKGVDYLLSSEYVGSYS